MLETMKANRVRSKRKVDCRSGKELEKPTRSVLGIVLAIPFIAFGLVNLVHPLELSIFQATCGKRMFLPCWFPSQQIGPFGARVIGLLSVLLGAAIGWFAVIWPRK